MFQDAFIDAKVDIEKDATTKNNFFLILPKYWEDFNNI